MKEKMNKMNNIKIKNNNSSSKNIVNNKINKINKIQDIVSCNNKKNKMLIPFDEYFDNNVCEEDKSEIEFQAELISKLIEVRNSKKYSQRKLAEICNVKQPEIARIESFKCSPQVDTLIKLLVPLGYTLKIEAIN